MAQLSMYDKVSQDTLPVLIQYVPVVDRVHGDHHPEFHDVRKLFDVINQKTKENHPAKPLLDEEFIQLKEITHDYEVPNDVCETYEAVYVMLKQLNAAYDE
ncbi:MAG: iron-sulfur cluster repair di-iron protein, ric [Erysipelotrichaceae bacterium]|nr:iron-sulfur cluster repair di-iron protein, ric [Erysipelotrichaceae bacterium]MDP3305221.1 iron-sulfur cluster repair di-iron protein, ric [Erysipelotrichaceae bacterium]